MRHTRAIARDRSKHAITAPPAEAVAARLMEIVHPAALQQVGYFHELGLRERVLNPPIMVGLVLGMIWREVGSVSELTRLIHKALVLWVPPLRWMTQQALAKRLQTLPAALFQRVLDTVLPVLHERWQLRRRPGAGTDRSGKPSCPARHATAPAFHPCARRRLAGQP